MKQITMILLTLLVVLACQTLHAEVLPVNIILFPLEGDPLACGGKHVPDIDVGRPCCDGCFVTVSGHSADG